MQDRLETSSGRRGIGVSYQRLQTSSLHYINYKPVHYITLQASSLHSASKKIQKKRRSPHRSHGRFPALTDCSSASNRCSSSNIQRRDCSASCQACLALCSWRLASTRACVPCWWRASNFSRALIARKASHRTCWASISPDSYDSRNRMVICSISAIRAGSAIL